MSDLHYSMNPEVYALWREAWLEENPGRIPPTNEQINSMMEMLKISAEEIFQIHDSVESNSPNPQPEV